MAGKKGGGGGPPPDVLLRWPAWALGVLAVGSAFSPLPPDFLRSLHWILCLFSLLEAGVALGRGRRTAFFVYAAAAVLLNPFRPFTFPLQVWRMIHAGTGLWLAADHLPTKK